MVKVITALFDIGRDKSGDGRTMDQYLEWFEKTLRLKTRIVVYTEESIKKAIENKIDQDLVEFKIQRLEEIPMYYTKEKIGDIISNPEYKSKILDNSRIECNLDLYNVIQYSKFGWLEKEIEIGDTNDFYFWMDAGCSRFFSDFDTSLNWPDPNKLDSDKFIIQGNFNTESIYSSMDIDEYKWDNNCILVGTLFGGCGTVVSKVSKMILSIFEDEMMNQKMVNNEQIALGILYKRNPDLFKVHIDLNGGHLPLFKYLA